MNNLRQRPPVRRVCAIHDLSCFGRCALSVIIPTLSAMGCQVLPLPTALMSTHTGGFTGFTMLPLTGEMEGIADHWERLGVGVDAVYTGFLASEEQIETVGDIIKRFGSAASTVLVDPVMGDRGERYQTVTAAMCEKMRRLCSAADIITPNITEAYLLLGEEPPRDTVSEAELQRLCEGMRNTGAPRAVITGVRMERTPDMLDCVCLDRDGIYKRSDRVIAHAYPGTGDIFASVLLGALLRGSSLPEAQDEAASFVCRVIRDTALDNTPEREGVALERNLYILTENRRVDNEKQ